MENRCQTQPPFEIHERSPKSIEEPTVDSPSPGEQEEAATKMRARIRIPLRGVQLLIFYCDSGVEAYLVPINF
jgi:hypothetical protein